MNCLPVACQVAHAHQLDKAQLSTASQAVVEHRHNLFVVVATQRHHVDLHLQASTEGLLNPLEYAASSARFAEVRCEPMTPM